MPFAMTHLHIAYNIISNTPEIKKPCDFMLGAIAPDSIHFRHNYVSDMKKISHLCVGSERWGRATNNQEWLENVLVLLKENKDTEKADFIYGYCSHILADIQNNIKIWTPFRLENKEALEKGLGSIYHQESNDVDYALYLLQPQQKIIWQMLEESIGYDIPNIVSLSEIDKMKHSILNDQFIDRKYEDMSSNKYVTLSKIQEFISVESQYIKKLLYSR
ncbi:zinc dependent phospholipase C family protein [Tissierella sp. MB52-C2]|uniref:zinc dependent phospholipase C family protein n=1 Tax=Tissierella sp. MB52-C2 TaxID=3070999 RepID=UPI00280B6D38|nr:zinc dependent phospholipase C family protein [Tissierella sp. MB52-C2]WMM23956.1 zinc dependent phospholipase C family protein [Tissierella sp. MB52-C2]